jgi:hypothetical protein
MTSQLSWRSVIVTGLAFIAGALFGWLVASGGAPRPLAEVPKDRDTAASSARSVIDSAERASASALPGSDLVENLAGSLWEAARQPDYARRTHDVVALADRLDADGTLQALDSPRSA